MKETFHETIRSAVISSRNLLRNGRSPGDVIPLLAGALGRIDDVPLLPIRIVLKAWLPEVIRSADIGDIDPVRLLKTLDAIVAVSLPDGGETHLKG
jgi:hypothetical protein